MRSRILGNIGKEDSNSQKEEEMFTTPKCFEPPKLTISKEQESKDLELNSATTSKKGASLIRPQRKNFSNISIRDSTR